jgi:hypothetical protein
MDLEVTDNELVHRSNEMLLAYGSIFDMGSQYDDAKGLYLLCESPHYISLAAEIMRVKGEIGVENASAIEKDAKAFSYETFTRPGGLIDQLKKHLDFDVTLFDKANNKHQYEIDQILFFFHMLENDYYPKILKERAIIKNLHIPKTRILELLSKPSIENIDSSPIGMETYNGEIIKIIKDALEMDLQQSAKETIKSKMALLSLLWDELIEKGCEILRFPEEYGLSNELEKITDELKSEIYVLPDVKEYEYSPIETLYLKIVQHEYLGQTADIRKLNKIKSTAIDDFNIPPELAEEMRNLHWRTVPINDVEKFVNENASRIAKFVYLRETNKDDHKTIKYHAKKGKIQRFIKFCSRAKPLLSIKDVVTELLIVSCLQAILFDGTKTPFEVTFPGYQKYMKHMMSDDAAFKSNEQIPDAIRLYWVRRVMDRWSANLGRYEARQTLKAFEYICDGIRLQIFTCPSIERMSEVHSFYFDKVVERMFSTALQAGAIYDFEQHLLKRGFTYIDDGYRIKHLFLCPIDEISGTWDLLIFLINKALEDNDSDLIITPEDEPEAFSFKLLFDYQNMECKLIDFYMT